MKEWGFADVIFSHKRLQDFSKIANGCAPKFVFRELVTLIVCIHNLFLDEHVRTI